MSLAVVGKSQHRHPAQLPETVEERKLLAAWYEFLSDPAGLTAFWRYEVGYAKAMSPAAMERLIVKIQDILLAQMTRAANRAGYDGVLRFRVYQAIRSRVGQLVLGIDSEQRQGLRRVIAEMLRNKASLAETQRLVRQAIGLTERQAEAVRRFYEAARASGYTQHQAAGRASGYARRLRRARAWAIARTEASWAYNYGRLEGWKEMTANGQLPWGGRKVWNVSAEGCKICVPLDGQRRPLDGYFDTGLAYLEAPPAHVNCRCVVDLYYPSA